MGKTVESVLAGYYADGIECHAAVMAGEGERHWFVPVPPRVSVLDRTAEEVPQFTVVRAYCKYCGVKR